MRKEFILMFISKRRKVFSDRTLHETRKRTNLASKLAEGRDKESHSIIQSGLELAVQSRLSFKLSVILASVSQVRGL